MSVSPVRACGAGRAVPVDDRLVYSTSSVSSRVSSTASLSEQGQQQRHGDPIATLLAAAEVLSSIHAPPAPVMRQQPPPPVVPVVVFPPPLVGPYSRPGLPCAKCAGSRADYWATVLGSGCNACRAPLHMHPMPMAPPPLRVVNHLPPRTAVPARVTAPVPRYTKPTALPSRMPKPTALPSRMPKPALGLQKTDGVHKKAAGRLKRHACDLCGARFAQRGGVNSHVRTVHLKQKRFQCEYPGCDRVFGHRGDATRHVRSFHQKLKPFKCGVCSAGFARKSVLVRHLKNVHREVTD